MKPFFSACLAIAAITIFSFSRPAHNPRKPAEKKIQVAILLDVSNSMDGLIEQAKAQLWNMVITLGKAECTDKTAPKVEVALYEYGRPTNDAAKGFVKQLMPFTNDLDSVSKILFGLVTNGGDEYCGQVIYTSIDELKWDQSPENYKVIFIAGNEDFLQGSLHYTKACDKAKGAGVIVNTIYCGDYQEGIRLHWNLLGECGKGSYTNINQDAKEVVIPTPYDSTLIVLNDQLNNTYIAYGAKGGGYKARQGEVDRMNAAASPDVAAKRIEAKSKSNVYNNSTWDLVDAAKADKGFFSGLDRSTLPDSLKKKTEAELTEYVRKKSEERLSIQTQISDIVAQRNKYIVQKKDEMRLQSNQPTLETAITTALKEQAKRFKMTIRE